MLAEVIDISSAHHCLIESDKITNEKGAVAWRPTCI